MDIFSNLNLSYSAILLITPVSNVIVSVLIKKITQTLSYSNSKCLQLKHNLPCLWINASPCRI